MPDTAERTLSAQDAVLGALIDRHGPCPLTRESGDPWYALVSAIISQQISTSAARGIRARFLERFGEDSAGWAERVARTSEERLRALGLSRTKAGAIRALARGVRSGKLDFETLARAPDDEVAQCLTAYRGVGPWTAEMFLLFGLRRLDIFAAGDLGIRRGMQTSYRLRKLPSERRMREISRHWRPYRGVACWYMWRAAE